VEAMELSRLVRARGEEVGKDVFPSWSKEPGWRTIGRGRRQLPGARLRPSQTRDRREEGPMTLGRRRVSRSGDLPLGTRRLRKGRRRRRSEVFQWWSLLVGLSAE